MQTGLPFPDISPEIVSFTLLGMTFALRWYAMAYIVGLLIGWRLAVAALRRGHLWAAGKSPMAPQQAEDLLSWIVIGVIAGGRLGYVLFYKPMHFLANPQEIPAVWQGGMSFHGGFVGVVLAVWIWSRRKGVALPAIADMIALTATPAILLVRVANFINAELWGRPTTLPWGVIFPGEAAQDCGSLLPTLCARHPSQLYEALAEGLILGGLIMWLAFRRGALRRSWLLSGIFFTGYGLIRFLLEFVRQPDAQFVSPDNPLGLAFHLGGWGLTMGQTLSLPMILVGLWVVRRARARPA